MMKHCKTFDQYKVSKNDTPIDEGIITAAMGAVIGPKVSKAICNALGITKGPLFDLLNSNTFIRAVSAYLAY